MGIPAHLDSPALQAAEAEAKAKGLCGARYRRTMSENPWSRVCLKAPHDDRRHSDATPKPTSQNPDGTCQACFRNDLKVPNGKMSHHGYQRPGWGYQTPSCIGAREQPYERSCEVTKRMLALTLDYQARVEAHLATLHGRPDSLTYQVQVYTRDGRTGYTPATLTIPLDAPAGDLPHGIDCPAHLKRNGEPTWAWKETAHHPGYAVALASLVRGAEADLKATIDQAAFLKERIEAWKPVALVAPA